MLKVYTDSDYYEGDTITTPQMDVGLELMVGFLLFNVVFTGVCVWVS